MRIAVTDAPYLSPLIANLDAVSKKYGLEVSVVPEEEAAKMLLNFAVDVALLTPLGYGLGVGKVDYRIIRGPCAALNDYTGVAGIRFADNLEEVKTIASSRPQSFLTWIGALIMREKFEAPSNPVLNVTDIESPDCVIEMESQHSGGRSALDIGEEWFDMVETALPTALWVCRVEADFEKVAGIVTEMADQKVTERHVSDTVSVAEESLPRAGHISFRWYDDMETDITAALNLLFFHQVLPEIPEIKILGRDEL